MQSVYMRRLDFNHCEEKKKNNSPLTPDEVMRCECFDKIHLIYSET